MIGHEISDLSLKDFRSGDLAGAEDSGEELLHIGRCISKSIF